MVAPANDPTPVSDWRRTSRSLAKFKIGGAATGTIRPSTSPRMPMRWQQTISAQQPCFHPDLLRLKLAGSLTGWVRETRTRSFYAEPLTVGAS